MEHIPNTRRTDKCGMKSIKKNMSGGPLPLQVINKRKTKRCLQPKAWNDKSSLFSYNEKHWSKEKQTQRLIDGILLP